MVFTFSFSWQVKPKKAKLQGNNEKKIVQANMQKAASSRHLTREGRGDLPAVPEASVVSDVPFVHLVQMVLCLHSPYTAIAMIFCVDGCS